MTPAEVAALGSWRAFMSVGGTGHCGYATRVALRRRGADRDGLAWLGPGERAVHDTLRDPCRRDGWLFGRLLAKALILASEPGGPNDPRVAPGEIEIHSRDGLGRSTRPRALVRGRLQPWCLSIAHSDRSVLVALVRDPDSVVGVDLASFWDDASPSLSPWFTSRERRFIDLGGREGRSWRAAVVWAAKEAAYKALGDVSGFRPAEIEAEVGADGLGHATISRNGTAGGGHPDSARHGPRGVARIQRTCRVEIAAAGGEVVAVATAPPAGTAARPVS